MDFDWHLVKARSEELRREAQLRHLEKRLRTSRERRLAVRQAHRIWSQERKLNPPVSVAERSERELKEQS